jgi:Flp pilus assembly protein TadB
MAKRKPSIDAKKLWKDAGKLLKAVEKTEKATGKPDKVAGNEKGTNGKAALGCFVLFLTVVGIVLTIAVPPLGIAILLFCFIICLAYALHTAQKENKEFKKAKVDAESIRQNAHANYQKILHEANTALAVKMSS